MGNAARVGMFVTAFVVLLFGAYSVLGQKIFAPKTARYFAIFEDANGVVPGTRVLMAGVKVGQIEKVELADPRTARLTLSIENGTQIPTGTTALVPQSLVGLGDSPVTLLPPMETAPPLAPESVIPGRKGSPLDSILPESKTTVAEINKLLVEVRELISDDRFKQDARKLLANSDRTIQKFGDLAGNIDRLLTRNQTNVDNAILRGSRAVADVQRITFQVANMLEKGTLQKDAQAILAQLKETSAKADKLVGSMNTLVGDPNLQKITGNVAELTESSKKIANDVGEIANTGKSIAVNADAVTKNGVDISKNLVEATARAKEVTANAIEIEKSVKELLDKVNKIIPSNGTKGVKTPPVTLNADLLHSGDLDRFRTDLTATLGVGDGKLDIGFWDAFESNRFILQYGKQASPNLGYRYGIYAGKLGVGVDYRLSPRLSLRNDAWDLNRLRYDPKLRYDFGNGFVGWAGLENAFRRNTPVFGIGFSR
ncbi:MCE family protein [bacterium]|nr:MAG: MCE family protein [bacterium]